MRTVGSRLSCVLLSLCCCCGLAACEDSAARSAAEPRDATPVATEYFASEYGVRVGVRVEFSEDRRLTGARLVWDGGSEKVALYPLDGTDPEPPPETLDLPQGVQVSLEGSVVAACPDAPSLPVFEVLTVRDGKEITERYTPNGTSKFEDAFQQWCELPFIVTMTGSRSTPEGECTYWLRLHNPGPFPVVVVSQTVSGGNWSWESARSAVPAGTIGSVTIRGHGGPPQAPWESGHLLANGQPIAPGDGVATATASGDLC